MLSDVTIYRTLPIVNGFVQVPPNQDDRRNSITVAIALSTIPGAQVVQLSSGASYGANQFLMIPAAALGNCCALWPDAIDDAILALG